MYEPVPANRGSVQSLIGLSIRRLWKSLTLLNALTNKYPRLNCRYYNLTDISAMDILLQ